MMESKNENPLPLSSPLSSPLPSLAATRNSKKKDADSADSAAWWHSLSDDDECPITLEPLSSLPYPPFELQSSSAGGSTARASYHFDGFALASYIVSRAIFQNPLTRQSLTMEDCRRLDDYLDTYTTSSCSSSSSSRDRCSYQESSTRNTNSHRRIVRVAEAFVLREMVQVADGHYYREEEQNIRRADVLRSEATSALAGLFCFSSQRNNQHFTARARTTVTATYHRNDADTPAQPSVPVFGFDLHRTPLDMGEAVDEMEGLQVIDDDEVAVVASEAQAYQQVQASFPPLLSTNADSAHQQQQQQPVPLLDSKLLESLKTTAMLEQVQEEYRQKRLLVSRQRLSTEALERRQERDRDRMQRKRLYVQQEQLRQQEEEQLRRAQEELEHWRNDQWEQLRLLTEAQERRKVVHIAMNDSRKQAPPAAITSSDLVAKEEREKQELQDKMARQKATAAAKRKRAKERKQAKRADELKEVKAQERRTSQQKQKEASVLKCAACGDGILDCGFERNGSKFCSPKCARAGPC